ncbi:MAG: enoyl-CoA hydratase family protein [Planctomycetes bacterium]|nr:enoyl-CoA hydratase family protein [Planctomycetota bacterium]
MTPKTFIIGNRNGVMWVKFNRPEKLNALTFEVYEELKQFFLKLRDDNESKIIVITGQGRGFCSGGDINEIIAELVKMNPKQHWDFTKITCDVIGNIRTLRKPVIAAINGAATGAGACIALACDIRIASDQAKFAFLFPKVGLSGADMGACYLLPKVVGLGKATELLMTGDIIDSQEAYRIGLVNKVVPSAELERTATEFANKLLKGPHFSLCMTKDMLNQELPMGIDQALAVEASIQALCMEHKDFIEAYNAFKEKREPRFNQT